MEIAVKVPAIVGKRLADGGWRLADPLEFSRDPSYLSALSQILTGGVFGCKARLRGHSAAAGSANVAPAYLASGRPVVVQDTGFSRLVRNRIRRHAIQNT